VSKGITRKLQKTPKDQYTLTVPKTLVQILGWDDKDEIEFVFEKDALTLRRVKKK
jgi:bifunctional DNA-binding transcriptional regulator/antitoxin component of YhaV-PrlF toxin-antitoxin module